jgi:hypothetical protein
MPQVISRQNVQALDECHVVREAARHVRATAVSGTAAT